MGRGGVAFARIAQGRIAPATGRDRAGEAVAGALRLGPHEGLLIEEGPR
jgi:hypothetical protein